MPDVQVGGVRLYYEIRGEGEPMVLIPGFAAGRWLWFRQVESFAEQFRVITFDPRGVSKSESIAPQSIRQMADDVAGLLTAIGIEKAHVLGASFGGFVAQELTLSYPNLIRTLTLCCTSFGGPNHVLPSNETLSTIASTKELNTEERMRKNLLLAFSPAFIQNSPEAIEDVIHLRSVNEVPENVYLGQLQAAVAFDAESRLGAIKARTLVLSGDADIIVPVENSRNLARAISGAELRIIEGGSHTFFIEQPDEFNRVVTDFVSVVRGQLSVVRG